MTGPVKSLDNSAYSIGWIAALPHERAAAEAMLDEKHAPPQQKQPKDDNIYTLGSIRAQSGEHNIVIASLPAGRYGVTPAATAAAHMLSSFPEIKFGLMVGIGGGIPNLDDERDIRLGDVVVSQPDGSFGGVRQYDLGKATVDGFEERGVLACPPRVLLNGVSALQGKHETTESDIPGLLVAMRNKYPLMAKPRQGPGYVYQGAENDRLFEADYEHVKGKKDCRSCDAGRQIEREERYDNDPYVFYGTIASGNKVIKTAQERDILTDCFCVETEAAGLMNDFPCLVIRGICDYCDSHKNDRWQRYAAATAAAYMKELLSIIDVVDVKNTPEARMIMSELRDIKSSTNEIASTLKRQDHDKRREELYKWLTSLQSHARHAENQKARVKDTGVWLLEHPTFKSWISGTGTEFTRVLSCYGDPGVGKTIAASIVIDHLAKLASKKSKTGLGYVYCDYRDQKQLTTENIIGELVKQLLELLPEVPETISQRQENLKWEGKTMKINASYDVFKLTCAQFDQVYICLDALDELAVGDLRTLLNWASNEHSIQLFFTSRPHIREAIQDYFGKADVIAIEAHEEDIRLYISREIGGVNDVAPKAMDEDLRNSIATKIIDAAQKNFLLPVLQVRTVLQAVTKREREECLITLPQDLGKAFAGTLSRIQQQPSSLAELAKKVIIWIHLAERPLGADTLRTLLAIREGDTSFDPRGEPDMETLIACCHGLVTVQEETSIVRLVHYSLEEYLAHHEELFDMEKLRWHSAIAATCLTTLLFPNVQGNTDLSVGRYYIEDYYDIDYRSKEDPDDEEYMNDLSKNNEHLYIDIVDPESRWQGRYTPWDYASCEWGHHFRKSNELLGPAFELARKYLQSSWGEVQTSLRALGKPTKWTWDGKLPKDKWPAHVMAIFGLTQVGAEFLTLDPKLKGLSGVASLFLAADYGHEDLVSLLVQKGYATNEQDSRGETLLHRAARNGHAGVAKVLIEAGASMDIVDYSYRTALALSAKWGHERVVEIMLDCGAVVNPPSDVGFSPLYFAAQRGNESMARLLIAKGADPSHPSRDSQTPLHVAAYRKQEIIISLLLEQGIPADPVNDDGQTPLSIAATCGILNSVRMLIEHGAQVNQVDAYGMTPLTHAAIQRRKDVVRLLLEEGADVNLDTQWQPTWDVDLCLRDNGYVGDIEDLFDIMKSSSTWREAVKAERKGIIELLLDCKYFPHRTFASLSDWDPEYFHLFVTISGKFPEGPRGLDKLQVAIEEAGNIADDQSWEWKLTIDILWSVAHSLKRIKEVGSFALSVCHEVMIQERKDSLSSQDVAMVSKAIKLFLKGKWLVEAMWIEAKRDILYSESQRIELGLLGWNSNGTSPTLSKDMSELSNESTFDGESTEGNSTEDEWFDKGWLEVEQPQESTVGEEVFGERSGGEDSAEEVSTEENLDEERSIDEHPERWRGWNLGLLQTVLKNYARLLDAIYAKLALKTGTPAMREAVSDETYQLTNQALRLAGVCREHHDSLHAYIEILNALRRDKDAREGVFRSLPFRGVRYDRREGLTFAYKDLGPPETVEFRYSYLEKQLHPEEVFFHHLVPQRARLTWKITGAQAMNIHTDNLKLLHLPPALFSGYWWSIIFDFGSKDRGSQLRCIYLQCSVSPPNPNNPYSPSMEFKALHGEPHDELNPDRPFFDIKFAPTYDNAKVWREIVTSQQSKSAIRSSSDSSSFWSIPAQVGIVAYNPNDIRTCKAWRFKTVFNTYESAIKATDEPGSPDLYDSVGEHHTLFDQDSFAFDVYIRAFEDDSMHWWKPAPGQILRLIDGINQRHSLLVEDTDDRKNKETKSAAELDEAS